MAARSISTPRVANTDTPECISATLSGISETWIRFRNPTVGPHTIQPASCHHRSPLPSVAESCTLPFRMYTPSRGKTSHRSRAYSDRILLGMAILLSNSLAFAVIMLALVILRGA